MYAALSEHMLGRVGCTVPWNHFNDRVCTEPGDVNTTFYIAWNRITNQKRDCSSPCQVRTIYGRRLHTSTGVANAPINIWRI